LARVLVIGCGCRGRELSRALLADGHAVRGTTRDPARAAELRADGIEPWVGDPDRVATVAFALERVAVVVVLLGSAVGTPEALAALHGTRLEMLLSRVLDSAVRGFVYEGDGTVDRAVLGGGAAIVRSVCVRSRIPFVVVDGEPTVGALRDAVNSLLLTK
jgi:nucleoside-diphosphate-sugar epimerase